MELKMSKKLLIKLMLISLSLAGCSGTQNEIAPEIEYAPEKRKMQSQDQVDKEKQEYKKVIENWPYKDSKTEFFRTPPPDFDKMK